MQEQSNFKAEISLYKSEATAALIRYSYEHGVLTLSAGTNGNVVRFLMPLVLELSDLEVGLNVIEDGLRSLTP